MKCFFCALKEKIKVLVYFGISLDIEFKFRIEHSYLNEELP